MAAWMVVESPGTWMTAAKVMTGKPAAIREDIRRYQAFDHHNISTKR